MYKRKIVVFQIEKENKVISEFNENITILYLKIYIRDRTNISNFDLYHKGKIIKNNNIPLYKFSSSKTDKIIYFYLKPKQDNNKNILKSNKNENNNLYTIKNKNSEKLKLYEKEISFAKEKNNQLINNINKYKENINEYLKKENKNKEKYRSIENLLIKQKEEIQLLKTEINEANIKYKDLKNKSVEKEIKIKNNQLKYTKSNDNFAIISNNIKPKRCFSVESFNTFYPIKNKYKNHSVKSIDLSNIHKNRSSSSTNINTSKENNIYNNNQLKISTNYISNINKNTKKKSKEINNIEITDINNINNINKNSRNERMKNKNNINSNNNIHIREKSNSAYYLDVNNLNKYKFQIKEFNTNNNEIKNEINNNINKNNIIINTSKMTLDTLDNQFFKEEESIDFNKILNEFKNSYNIKQLLSKDNLDNKDYPLIMTNLYEKYFHIFKYLNNNEILLFSSINKPHGICVLYYWMDYLQNKINYLNDIYSKLSSRYNSLTDILNTVDSKSNNILSYFSKSGLRVLNSPHYLDIFNKPNDYFTKDNIFLFIYKMFFQFIKLYDENKKLSDDEFISFMTNEIKEKTKIKKSLKEYIYNLLDKEMDFSFENVLKAKNIMKYYKIENIEGNQLAKIDRASTIIGYVVRDLMGFTGLGNRTTGSGRKSSSSISEKKNNNNNKIEDDISFNSFKNKIINVCEMIDNEKNKCENVIKKIKEIIIKYYNIK